MESGVLPVNSKIRILVVDDHAIVREGLCALLNTEPDLEVVGQASDGIEAIAQAKKLQPDVILLDLVMPRKDGVQAIKEIMLDNPQSRILVLTSFAEDDLLFPAIKAGAHGYLLKDSSPQELLQAIKEIHCGQSSLHPAIARKLIAEMQNSSDQNETVEPLTDREVEILTLLAQGLPNKAIAEKLTLSERTVRTHVTNILSKLHLANRTQAALFALRKGIAKPENGA
ncbi:MAG: response regulator transcription factor [Anaerolineae bacterium]|nr:response regulator transcription factor [Anaerolineae bacterium]